MRYSEQLVRASEMAEIDACTQREHLIDGSVLMENAGRRAWELFFERYVSHGDVHELVFLAGGGNNGGDALVMARYALLTGRFSVAVVTLRVGGGKLFSRQLEILSTLQVVPIVWQTTPAACREVIARGDWLIDGVTGTGLHGPLRGDAASLVEAINGAAASVCAVDVPSGMRDGAEPGEVVVRADATIVTGYRKAMLYTPAYRPLSGEIHLVDPGFPPQQIERVLSTRPSWRVISARSCIHPVPPDPDGYKGSRGRVVVVGGSGGAPGAAVLAALGATSAGAGIVKMIACQRACSTALNREPGLLVQVDEGEREASEYRTLAEQAAAWADCVVIGPGWIDATEEMVEAWVLGCERSRTPIVLDAAALRVLSRSESPLRERVVRFSTPVVFTPHIGELSALIGIEAPLLRVRLPEVVAGVPHFPYLSYVCKGAVTWVVHGDGGVDLFDGRTAQLGVAGSGDVLSGVIGAAIAALTDQTPLPDVRKAISAGVALHLRAGRSLSRRRRAFGAGELSREIACVVDGGMDEYV